MTIRPSVYKPLICIPFGERAYKLCISASASEEFGHHVCLRGTLTATDRRAFARRAGTGQSTLGNAIRVKPANPPAGFEPTVRERLVKSPRDSDDNQCFPISATSNGRPDTRADGDVILADSPKSLVHKEAVLQFCRYGERAANVCSAESSFILRLTEAV